MSRGWGLTLDSDPISFFANNPMNHHHHTTTRGNIFSPVNLNRGGDDNNSDHRMAVGEVDFFSDKRRSNDVDSKAGIVLVKKEINVNTGLHLLTTNTGSDQSTLDDGVSSDADDKKRAKNELAVIQAELERVNAENQRLREMLTQVNNNYNALQMHLVAVMQQEQANRSQIAAQRNQVVEERQDDKRVTPRQFMELGPSGTEEPTLSTSSEERTQSGSLHQRNEIVPHDQEKSNSKGIAREDTPESEGWAPNKVQKLIPGAKPSGHVEQAATEATMRKARVSVRARSEAPMITDGCQWRKYGQKMAKGNPCPRAYYRCTMAVACPVRKQVQRCAEDKTILITTYEGTHNHPLPPAAMAMASTTSAAASMLLSGSMPSGDGLMNPNFLARTILPCSSNMATISASAPFPTVTLDLTHSPNPLQQFQRPPPPQFQLPFATPPPGPHVFGQSLGLYNQSQFSGLQLSSQPHMQQQQQQQESSSSQLPHTQQQQHSFADTLSAATAAITADPNFTAALAAAISSIIGGAHPNGGTANNTSSASTTTTTATGNNNNNNIGGFPGN